PWPLPQQWSSLSSLVSVAPKEAFSYSINVENCEPLVWATTRKYNYDFLFGKDSLTDPRFPALSKIDIKISTNSDENLCNEFPKLSSDRTYESCKNLNTYNKISQKMLNYSLTLFISRQYFYP